MQTPSPAAVTFRDATLADLPAIIALLADDVLGHGREQAGSPPDRRYVDAFLAIDADPNQTQAVAVMGRTWSAPCSSRSCQGWRGPVPGAARSRVCGSRRRIAGRDSAG